AKLAFKFQKAFYQDGLVSRPLRRPSNKRRNRGCYPSDRVDGTGQFLDVDARIRQGLHVFVLLEIILCSNRRMPRSASRSIERDKRKVSLNLWAALSISGWRKGWRKDLNPHGHGI